MGLHQVRGGGSGRQRGAWSAAVAITFHPTAQHLLAAITHTVTYCFWLQLHSYTMTHCFWLQLQSYTWFLAAVTHTLLFGCKYTHSYALFLGCNYTHGYTLFLAAIMHKVTLFLDAITHTHTHSDTSFMAAIIQ